MIWRRLEGLRKIINVATPILSLFIAISILFDLQAISVGPVQEINASVAEISHIARDGSNTLGEAFDSVGDIGKQLKQSIQDIQLIPQEVTIPELSIPDISLPLKPVIKLTRLPLDSWSSNVELSKNRLIDSADLMPEEATTGAGFILGHAGLAPTLSIFGRLEDLIDEIIPDSPPSIPGLNPSIKLEEVKIDMPDVPGFTMTVPGILEIKEVLITSIESLNIVNDFLSEVPNFDLLGQQLQGLIDSIQGILGKLKILVFIVVIGILFLASFGIRGYISWSREQLTSGWRLLRNR